MASSSAPWLWGDECMPAPISVPADVWMVLDEDRGVLCLFDFGGRAEHSELFVRRKRSSSGVAIDDGSTERATSSWARAPALAYELQHTSGYHHQSYYQSMSAAFLAFARFTNADLRMGGPLCQFKHKAYPFQHSVSDGTMLLEELFERCSINDDESSLQTELSRCSIWIYGGRGLGDGVNVPLTQTHGNVRMSPGWSGDPYGLQISLEALRRLVMVAFHGWSEELEALLQVPGWAATVGMSFY